ncbi:MAG: SUKH-3 domain-containing protein [Acutalibacteraceae bacterium]|nr:SUKH-3 domain-containing protein [Acutalibacteraceae bacterium]
MTFTKAVLRLIKKKRELHKLSKTIDYKNIDFKSSLYNINSDTKKEAENTVEAKKIIENPQAVDNNSYAQNTDVDTLKEREVVNQCKPCIQKEAENIAEAETQSSIKKPKPETIEQEFKKVSFITPNTNLLSEKSKKRFPKEVLETLMRAGWYEGRKIDVTEQLKRYEACGFEIFDALPKFLEEFDKLYFCTYSTFQKIKQSGVKDKESLRSLTRDYFDVEKAMHFNKKRFDTPEKIKTVVEDYDYIAKKLDERFVPIGEAYMNLILTESGKIYMDVDGLLDRLGVTVEEGITNLILGKAGCKLYIINKELGILSRDEIISGGEYSETELDINKFEADTINAGKENYVIYSKYANGNIKYYYRLRTHGFSHVVFQDIYKITYYESGNIKDYTAKRVNEEALLIYEWYEHGEIKSVIEYHNENSIICRNYAENGAFIDESSEKEQHITNAVYIQEEKKKPDTSITCTDKAIKSQIVPKGHKYAIDETPDISNLSDESKQRFSEKTLEMLLRAGWYEGRKIDVTQQLERYKNCGFETFDILTKFLEEFDKLYFKKYDVFKTEQRYELRGDKYNAKPYSCFDATKNRKITQYEYHTGVDLCQSIQRTVKERCVPIGQDQSNNTIFLTESGQIYLNGHFPKRLGSNIAEGINALIDNDYNSCEMRVINQDLDILSNNEIISKGKCSGYEPDIKDFEITAIELGKKNYIMYSKYSNGNIKHYYQYKTYIQRFTEYKYVYKVTYYESGKVKDYTETKVNNTDIKTYEWYEHGGIKSVIDYHNNNSIICKSYDENGAFIGRSSKKEQYITNDVYIQREAKKKPNISIIYTDKAIKSKIVPKGHKYAIDETPDTSKLSAKSKQRFPKEVLEMLMRAGWYEGRKIDVTEQLKRYENCGFEIFDALPKFLEEFDKLYFCKYRTFNEYKKEMLKNDYSSYSPTRDYFDAEKAMYIDKEEYDTPEKIKAIINNRKYTRIAKELKERFVPIGQAYIDLYLTESGKIYMDVGPFTRLGVTIEEGITHLILDSGGCSLDIIDQNLGILSNDEIISNGEYSEAEPDINDFETNAINADKKDYIMYSKYDNGNIKHYYLLRTHDHGFSVYQYICKVTYYESGKVKDYSRKRVNKEDIDKYEWYENGEVKTVIYYRTDYTIYRKFAENGAFIGEEDIPVKK